MNTTYDSSQYNENRPNVGVTIVPFIYEDNIIKTLMYKRKADAEVFASMWALPNAIFDIKREFENLESLAQYALKEKTNVALNHIEKVDTFSGSYIDPRIMTVNVCFLSLCNRDEIINLGDQKFDTQWISVEEALKEELAFNHNEVLQSAYARLCSKAEYTALTAHLLPKNFTIAEFKGLIELLIGKPLDNSRFRDRIKKSDILFTLEGEFKRGANRPAQLYQLNDEYKDYFYPMSLTKPN